MDDLISRQAAIDEISKYGSVWMEYTDGMRKEQIAEEALKSAKAAMIQILNALPSAEPERKDGAEQTEPQTEKVKCPFDDPIPCEWVNCPNSTDCPWK